MIIGLGGKKESGKSEAASYLSKKFNLKKVAFATELKKLIFDISGLDDSHKKDFNDYTGNVEFKIINSVLKKNGYSLLSQYEIDTITAIEYHKNADVFRLLCQYVGTEVFRKRNVNHWIDKFIESVKNLNGFICDDIRFPNEHNIIKHKFNDSYIKTIKIISTKTKNQTNNTNINNHDSEILLDKINFDITILNDHNGLNKYYNELDNIFSNVVIK